MRKIICPININTKAKAKDHFQRIDFTLISVSMVIGWVRKKGVFWKRGLFRKSPFFLENLEILEFLENPQTLENKGESDHFQEILEN